ncbi:hypothetical protein QUF80_08990 [Desulfococcaceae bacterium HSG8]|nr:hypothetical protein [Desulfococcaceae bacterium HSG8]
MSIMELTEEIRLVRLRHSRRFSYVKVLNKPNGWYCAGVGNSAAVFRHDRYPDIAIKIFSDICTHIALRESEVYRKLGDSSFYPKLYGSGKNYLVLRYIPGQSAYECLLEGMFIQEQVVSDINEAVSYARQRGLNPRNLHAKNILVYNGRGYLVDVSDYMKNGRCYHFDILRYIYYKLYIRFSRPGMRIPFWLLESIRRGYRLTASFLKMLKIKKSETE